MKRLILAALAVFAIAALPASANKIKPSLNVSPAAPVAYQAIVVSGCGYVPAHGVTVVLYAPEFASFAGQPADAAGCISLENFSVGVAGSYALRAYQSNDHHADAVLNFSVG